MNTMQAILKAKNVKAVELLHEWLADESGYDEAVWPRIKELIDMNRISERKRFDDESGDAGHGAIGKDNTSTTQS